VGLRPGEKLHEELVGQGEIAVPSSLEKILQIRSTCLPGFEWFKKQLIGLEAAAYLDKPDVVIERLKELVPTFCPSRDLPQPNGQHFTSRNQSHVMEPITHQ
jgi:FlaA1/EpsC-like NDP-sugar epimerase